MMLCGSTLKSSGYSFLGILEGGFKLGEAQGQL